MADINSETECFVFRTDLQSKKDVKQISETINGIPGIVEWSVDLEDWEKVLRIVGIGLQKDVIQETLRKQEVDIEELPV